MPHRYVKAGLGAIVVGALVAAVAGAGSYWLHDRLEDPGYCAGCHVIAPYYDTWAASDFTAHTHRQAGVDCQVCHARTTLDGLRELAVSAVDLGRSSLPVHQARASDCLRCHGSHDVLAGRTRDLIGPDGFALGRNPHDSHWGALECGICHKMHGPSVDFCANCHGSPATGAGWKPPR